MTPNYNNIPDILKRARCWVCWQAKPGDNGKVDKIPINPKNGNFAKSNNPKTWDNFNTAIAGVKRFNLSGIGFMFGGNEFFGVDIDKCRNKDTGELSDIAKYIISELDSYTEISPSGTGIHIICKGKLPEGGRRSQEYGLEMYDTGRFFTVTGNILDDAHCDVEDRTEQVARIHEKYIKKPEPEQKQQTVQAPVPVYMSDDDIIKKAIAAKNGHTFEQLWLGNWKGYYESQSQADQAFCNMLAFWCQKDKEMMDRIFRRSGLMRPKWNERRGQSTYGEVTIVEAIIGCNSVYEPKGDMKNPKSMNDSHEVVKNNHELVNEEHNKVYDYTMDDTGNAKRLIDLHGKDLHFSYISGKWYIWNGSYWQEDNTGEIKRKADDTIRWMEEVELRSYIGTDIVKHKQLQKWVARSRGSTAKNNMIKEAQHLEGIPILPEDMDKDQWLINCLNGTIDLRTGELRKHDRKDLITKIVDVEYDPKAKCLQWEKFLNQIFNGKEDLIKFIQRAVGYSLTGSIKEQCIFIMYGSGRNGKSTFIETICELLGEYAKSTSMDSFVAKSNDGINNDIARLFGSRLVSAIESEENKKLKESLIKQLTGGDKMTARFLRQEFFEFVPTFKIWMATNHKPKINGTDTGIWRRINLIPFDVTIRKEDVDKDLPEKLKKELPGILSWAIEGCKQWQKDGLKPPKEVTEATDEYRNEMDVVNSFLTDCCERSKNHDEYVKSKDLYRVYQEWCELNGEYAMAQRNFAIKLKEKGARSKKTYGINVWENIMLNKYGKSLLTGMSYKENEQVSFYGKR
jgi:putative DNA primase/helicase